MKNQRGFATIIFVLIITVLLGVIGYMAITNGQSIKNDAPQIVDTITPKLGDKPTISPGEQMEEGEYYTLDNYTFQIPNGFEVSNERNLEMKENNVHKSVSIANNLGIQLELVVNEGGGGIQCYEKTEEVTKTVGSVSAKWLTYKGTGPTEIFPNCNETSKYIIWIILDEYEPPKEGIKDMIWYSFDSNQVEYEQAILILNQITSTIDIN